MSLPCKLVPISEAQPPYYIGVDVGGTNIKIGVVDDQAHPVAYTSMPTEIDQGAEGATVRIASTIDSLLDQAEIDRSLVEGVGLATPGIQDVPTGMLLRPHNLPGWDDFPIRDRLNHHTHWPVTFANDANAAAFGEYWAGSGRGSKSMLLLTLGTGIGGGIIIRDRTIDGEHSLGGECGHIVIDVSDQARICPCGGVGHLEAYASATAVIKSIQTALAAGQPTSIADRVAAGEAVTPLLAAEEAEKGDEFSRQLILDTARFLGIGIASFVHVLDPDAIVLGGAMTFGRDESPLGREFLAQIREATAKQVLFVLVDKIKIDYASLGGDAGFIGAAGLARVAHQTGESGGD